MNINKLSTPCYIIKHEEYVNSIMEIMKEYNSRWNDNVIFGYSVKTNHLPYLMKIARDYGWWSEVVSPAEYNHGLRQGFDSNKVIYNGPQKFYNLIEAAKTGGIINIDSFKELDILATIPATDIKAKIGLRINFDLEELCPGETTVGQDVGRFGISYENGDFGKAVARLESLGIKISGIHMHSSTSSRSLELFRSLANKAIEIIKEFSLDDIEYIDMGGGFFGGNFFKNKPSVKEYATVITDTLKQYIDSKKVMLVIEPGAAILATAADYLTKVISVRDIRHTRVVTVDGTCLHINSFMKSKQQTPCTIIDGGDGLQKDELQVIGGSTCMEMDRLYPRDITCRLTENSKLLFHCAGAYTMTHNSNFINLLPNIYTCENGEYMPVRIGEAYMMEI